ncbi:MAG: SDR family NAD(P)-dependent oxidoreductase [Mariniblastus sp.]|nr:SDR family NAD(P)-dependent oxidoreductase [Mariniblastus sp.]
MNLKTNHTPVCLVTGGSSGIGLATALLFAEKGYEIAICGRRESNLLEAKRVIDAALDGRETLAMVADLEDTDRALEVAEETMSRFGRIDLLVNNAAASPLEMFHEISSETFETTINTNVRSLFYLTQAIWKKMRTQRSGVVVNISSLSAVDPFKGLGFYGACKAWMDLMTQALASEGAELGLRVCSIRPGAVETPMLRRLFPDFPAEQCVQPRIIAEAIWGCVSEPENYPSGEAFTVTAQP